MKGHSGFRGVHERIALSGRVADFRIKVRKLPLTLDGVRLAVALFRGGKQSDFNISLTSGSTAATPTSYEEARNCMLAIIREMLLRTIEKMAEDDILDKITDGVSSHRPTLRIRKDLLILCFSDLNLGSKIYVPLLREGESNIITTLFNSYMAATDGNTYTAAYYSCKA